MSAELALQESANCKGEEKVRKQATLLKVYHKNY